MSSNFALVLAVEFSLELHSFVDRRVKEWMVREKTLKKEQDGSSSTRVILYTELMMKYFFSIAHSNKILHYLDAHNFAP